jgi:predicted Zn-dependent peptidase
MNRTFVTLYTLKKFFPQTIEMVQQMLFEPTFSEEQFSTIRANNKAQFMVNMQKGDVLAMRALRRSVYGEAHPCGMSTMAEDYDALRTEILADFYGRYYGSRNCTVYLSGSIDENVTSRIESCFGGAEWGGCLEVGQRDYSLSPAIDKKNFIAHPGAVQCSIRMGSLLMDVKDEDYLPMRVLNTVLGGYFGSRLMKNVREDKGYTYHISSDLVTNTSQVMFMISCEALADKAEEVMAEVKGEMERLRTQLVSDAELHMVRSYMMGEICRNYEGAFSLTDAYIFMDHLGLPQSHIEDTVAAVRATDAARLLQLARRYFDFETLHTVVVHP